MNRFSRRIFTRKAALRLALALILFIALIVAFYAEKNWRGQRAWAAYRTDAERRGVKLDLKDFLPPPVPDAENFAAIPIFEEIFRASEANEPPPKRLEFPESKATQPTMGEPSKAERIDLAAWRDFFVKNKLLDAPGPVAATDVLGAVGHYEPLLQQLRDGTTRPHANFPVKWEKDFAAPLSAWLAVSEPSFDEPTLRR